MNKKEKLLVNLQSLRRREALNDLVDLYIDEGLHTWSDEETRFRLMLFELLVTPLI